MAVTLDLDLGGAVVGVVGIVYAAVADHRARRARRDTKTANDIAEQALAEARAANSIAEQQAARESERWFVDWTVQWEEEGAVLVIANVGSHPALDVSIVVQAPGFHYLADRAGDLEPGQEVTLTLAEIAEERQAHLLKNVQDASALRGTGVGYVPKPYSRETTVAVTWSTGLGRPQTKSLEKTLT